ncbi:MAG: hypothetical protein WAW13_00420 [Minisyncoccia bacterium]
MNQVYIYELLVDGIVRYVGMGSGDRIRAHWRAAVRINKRLSSGRDPQGLRVHLNLASALRAGSVLDHRFVAVGLTRDKARAMEVRQIASWPADQLWNEHPGGGGASPERMVELWADPEWRDRQVALLTKVWTDPIFRAEMVEARSDPAIRAKISKSVSSRFARLDERMKQSQRTASYYSENPQARQVQSEMARARWANPENHDRLSKAVTAHWNDPAHRERQSEAAKKQWADPVARENLLQVAGEKWTPELREWRAQKTREQFADPAERERMREATKARWQDPAQRKKMSDAIRAGKAKKKLALAQKAPQNPVN